MKRIVSFLPSATEIVYALGLGENLVGVTHECDYPPAARTKPAIVRNVLPVERMSQAEIDRAVAERMRDGKSLYVIDEPLLQELSPDLILTQNLCQVCAPSGNEISEVLPALKKQPEILWLTPRSVSEIFENIRAVGVATGTEAKAKELIRACEARIERLKRTISEKEDRPRVFCLEWIDPVYASGHWVPELVRMAGGVDGLGSEGGESVRVSWEQITEWAPEVIVFMPCGFNLQQTMKQIWSVFGKYSPRRSEHAAAFFSLPAVQTGRVYAVDANAFFARPGPRVIEGAELLAQIFDPELLSPSDITDHSDAFQLVDTSILQGEISQGRDFVFEGDTMVFTADYLRRRGYCCDSGCRNCPWPQI